MRIFGWARIRREKEFQWFYLHDRSALPASNHLDWYVGVTGGLKSVEWKHRLCNLLRLQGGTRFRWLPFASGPVHGWQCRYLAPRLKQGFWYGLQLLWCGHPSKIITSSSSSSWRSFVQRASYRQHDALEKLHVMMSVQKKRKKKWQNRKQKSIQISTVW